jgi:RNA polymerase sigma factor (sigma-70 family)
MRTMGDWELLQNYVKIRSEAAFTELVQRNIDWIHSLALRRVGNPQLAQDVVQSVFALLARKAGSMRAGTVLGGWLFRSTCFVAKCSLRAERRRKSREEIASAMMTTTQPGETELYWERLAPHLDDAVASLSEADRSLVLLRFYQRKSLSEVGQHLGLSEDAAKKRVSRTVEKLRGYLTRRGVTLGGAVLAGLLVERVVQAAPAAITASVLKTSRAGLSVALPQLARETLSAWRWAKIKLVSAAGFTVVLVALLLHTVSAGRLLKSGNLLTREVKPSLTAQASPANTEEVTESKPGAVSDMPRLLFRAVSAASGRGIAGGRVAVSYVTAADWIRRDDLVTDNEGCCSVPLPADKFGRLDVGVLKDGFVEKFYTWREDYGVPLPPACVLKLEAAVSIGGRVQDAAGNPVSGAEIGLSFYGTGDATSSEPAPERLGFVGEAVTAVRTDAQGNWRCALTPPGYSGFRIDVQHPNYVQGSFWPEVGLQATQDTKRLRMEDLWAAKAVMVLEPGFEVRGFVLDDTGNALAAAKVSWMGDSHYRQDGVKTGPGGSFRVTSLPQGAGQISAWAKGFAPSLAPVQISSSTREVVFRLSRGATFSLKIADEDDAGIPGAWAALDLPVPHNGDFRLTTDAAGRGCFEGIPTNALNGIVCHAGAKGYFYSRNVRLNPNGPEPSIRLVKSLHVSGTVLDADTREAVLDFKAIPCRGEGSYGYDRSNTKHGQLGTYAVDFTEPEFPFRVRVEADGYEPAMSPSMGQHPSEQEQNFLLHRKDTSRAIHGVVVLPDGQPAANARVALLTFEQGITLYRGTFKRENGAILATADAQGEFKFDADPHAHTLVAADPVNGFGLLRMHRATQPFKLQLQPWGRIEGRVVLSGSPAPNQKVFITSGLSAYRSVRDGLYAASDFISTDGDGRFICELVPPGDVTLYLSQGSGQPHSHQTVAEVRAGETVQVQIGGRGRLVIGRLVMSDGSHVDWSAQLIVGSLTTNLKRPAVQPPTDSHDVASRLRIMDFFDESEEWRAYERAGGTFPLQVAADGSFTIEDVPPGPYQLFVRISDSAYTGNSIIQRFQRRITASAKEDVVVPDELTSLVPVDLGTFSVQPSLAVHN